MRNKDLATQLFFAKEAAEYLGISTQRLNKLVQNGKIVPIKKTASGTLFHIEELEKRKEELHIFDEMTGGRREKRHVFNRQSGKTRSSEFLCLNESFELYGAKIGAIF